MRVFKAELRAARADLSLLPGDELSESVEYDDGSDEAFLRRLWYELYGDEPLGPLPGPAPGRPPAPGQEGEDAQDAFYRQRQPEGPFATLIAVAASYLHPENYDPGALKRLARREDVPRMRVFKAELLAALADPGRLPGDELSESVGYGEGSDEAFLRRLWRDLYGDEPANPVRHHVTRPPGAARATWPQSGAGTCHAPAAGSLPASWSAG